MEQSLFHHNESGSQNMTTLAVAGKTAIVPLVEGHAATRERWTANLTTFSNEERLKKEGPPYCEIMFKATPEGKLEKRLSEHIRSRGYGPWVSVTTAEKGSYRQADVLAFLEKHLPKVDEQRSRRWRIIMADDYSAHLSPQVFALCWSRRYVFIPHGGGVTPVAQTQGLLGCKSAAHGSHGQRQDSWVANQLAWVSRQLHNVFHGVAAEGG